MTVKLTAEQRQALNASTGPVPVEDEETHELFFLIDQGMLDEFRRQGDREAIRAGIADLEAGRLLTLEELDARVQQAMRRTARA